MQVPHFINFYNLILKHTSEEKRKLKKKYTGIITATNLYESNETKLRKYCS